MIQKLPENIIEKISAGEVITSIYSAIKELIENSIDAGATEITIRFFQKANRASSFKISIKDNGVGIGGEDLEFLCINHYTSKHFVLNKPSFTEKIESYGFRGEALNSISRSAKKIIVRTVTDNSNLGFECVYEDTLMISKKKKALAFFEHGTEIEIDTLFYSNKIRKNTFYTKGLLQCKELEKITELGMCYEIANRDRKLIINIFLDNQRISDTPQYLLLECLKDTEFLTNVHSSPSPFSTEELPFAPLSFLHRTSTELSQINIVTVKQNVPKNSFFLIINKRVVQNDRLMRKIFSIYRTSKNYKDHIYYHFVFILIETRGAVDVNVHPSKDKILVEDDCEVYDLIISHLSNFQTKQIDVNSNLITGTNNILPFSPKQTLSLSENIPENSLSSNNPKIYKDPGTKTIQQTFASDKVKKTSSIINNFIFVGTYIRDTDNIKMIICQLEDKLVEIDSSKYFGNTNSEITENLFQKCLRDIEVVEYDVITTLKELYTKFERI